MTGVLLVISSTLRVTDRLVSTGIRISDPSQAYLLSSNHKNRWKNFHPYSSPIMQLKGTCTVSDKGKGSSTTQCTRDKEDVDCFVFFFEEETYKDRNERL